MKVYSDTAILLFSESAKVQADKKMLDPSSHQNYQLIEKLNRRSGKVVKQSGLDLVHIDERQQQGESFGEKLSNAIQYVLSLGYTRIITIGNDCPDLTAKDLIEARSKLEKDDIVVGPDYRGGTYLIGIGKGSFDPIQFKKLTWQTSSLRSSFIHYAYDLNFSINWLAPKADLNDATEVKRYWKQSAGIRKLVSQLLEAKKTLFLPQSNYGYLQTVETSRRGPPYG